MTGNFDDMMKSRLDGLESDVPQDMFDDLRSRLDAIDQSFDGAVKNRIRDYSAPVPADMWKRIQREKDKDKRRPFAWWWAAALLFLMGAGGWYYLTLNEKASNPHQKTPAVAGGSFQITGPGDNHKLEDAINSAPVSNNPANELNKQSGKNDPSENQVFGNSSVATKSIKNKKDGIGVISNRIRQKDGILYQGDDPLALPVNDFNNVNPANNVYPASGADMKDWIRNDDRQLALKQLIRSSFNLKKLSPGQLLEAQLKSPIIPCPVNGDENRNDWYVDLYASPMMLFKNLSGNGAGKNTILGMDSTLYKQVSFNAGVNLVKNISEHFLLKTGVQYNQVNEVFRNTRVNEIKLITTVTIRTVILAPGDTIYIRDTSVIQQIGTVMKQTQNHYKSWDIPIIVSYEFGGKDLRLNANLGVIANIRSSYSGEMLDTTQQPINIAWHNNTGIYKTKIGFGVYAGLGLLKSIGERADLLVEPHARFNLVNMTTDPGWFTQKNILAGVSIGIRYKLNGRRQR